MKQFIPLNCNFFIPLNCNFSRALILTFLLAFSLQIQGQCTPTGDVNVYGVNSWNAYVYSDFTSNSAAPFTPLTATYRGYTTFSDSFDMNLGTAAISGSNICGSYTDNFAMRLTMRKTFAAGNYTFTIGGDEGYRLSLDGGRS